MQFFTCINALAVAAVLLLANVTPVASRTSDDAVAGRYIVLLKPDTIASIDAHYNKVRSIHARNLRCRGSRDSSTGIVHRYQLGQFIGYAGSFDNSTIKELEALPEVLSVEPDSKVKLSLIAVQNPAPWNLAQLSRGLDNRSGNSPKRRWYAYDSTAGRNTFSYVLDSGIRLDHEEFGGRAIFGYNAAKYDSYGKNDEVGHGTQVASIIGGTTHGVAKKTILVSVKIGGTDEPYISDALKGLNWAVKDIVRKKRQKTAVINISLASKLLLREWDRAITAAFNHGVLVVAAAGNDNKDAAGTAPCRSPESICVGSVQQQLRISPHSNYGPAVNVYAPGTGIPSAYFKSKKEFITGFGTSFAAPQVAGLVSYLRGLEGPSTAAEITARVYALSKEDVVGGLPDGSNNLLAHNGLFNVVR